MAKHNYVDNVKVLNDEELFIVYIHKGVEYSGILSLKQRELPEDNR